MKNYDKFEEEAIEKTKNKKVKMKTSGKSVFLLSKMAGRVKKR
jgi:hypothetical protein